MRQFRLAKGMSLDALACAMGGVVTKQSLSKYEREVSLPSHGVLENLAQTLGVDIGSLYNRPIVEIEVIEYRKHSKLSKREQNRVESLVQYMLEERLRLLDMLGEFDGAITSLYHFQVNSLEEAEQAAERLRIYWGLGEDPIPSMVALLENKRIHVMEIDAAESFDGLSLRVRNNERTPVSAGVVTRRNIPGERQRLSLAHELGHLVLGAAPDVDSEKAAFRFGAAFLAPAKTLLRDVGQRRKFVSAHELVLLKRRYRMSMQALLYRLHELAIINAHVYRSWCIMIGKRGWRKKEPHSLDTESPEWLNRLVHRAFYNRLLSERDAYRMLNLGQSDQDGVKRVESMEFADTSEIEIQEVLEKQLREMEEDPGRP